MVGCELIFIEQVWNVTLLDSVRFVQTSMSSDGPNSTWLTIEVGIGFDLTAELNSFPKSGSLLFSNHALDCIKANLFFRVEFRLRDFLL